jgi:hypothetical protein
MAKKLSAIIYVLLRVHYYSETADENHEKLVRIAGLRAKI